MSQQHTDLWAYVFVVLLGSPRVMCEGGLGEPPRVVWQELIVKLSLKDYYSAERSILEYALSFRMYLCWVLIKPISL